MFKRLGYAALIALTAVVFAIGGATTGQAKAKKKMAEAAPPPFICMMNYKPVCAETAGVRTTYANSCFAAKNGAKVLYQGACRVHKAMHKPMHKAMKKMAKPMKKKAMKKPMKKK